MMRDREKHAQINREARWTLFLYALFFLWWFGWGYSAGSGDPKDYTYLLGLPLWFVMSCIAGWLGISLALFWVIHRFFREVPFDDTPDSSSETVR